MRQHPAQLIQQKRRGDELSVDEIRDLVAGVVDGSLGDAQLGAFLMATCLQGMTPAETAALTLAMRDSGRVLPRLDPGRRRIDKHSTGGVGDKVSLLLAPMVAAAGVHVPMISGRGLGHTGGTIDKLEAIPGYRTGLDAAQFDAVLARCGFAMAQAGADLAPADRRMYALRDVTGTVDSLPLITSSILSKKLAENLDGLVLDVKVGRAAFLPSRAAAEQLRDSLVEVGAAAGLTVRALLTDMDHPLGRAIGNALEVREVLAALRGEGPADLLAVTLALGGEMLQLAGVSATPREGGELLQRLMDDGAAARAFRDNVAAQGGDVGIFDDDTRLGRAPCVQPVTAARQGFVTDVDPLALGRAVVELGGGRRQPLDRIDPLVGIELQAAVGSGVRVGDVLAWVHAADGAAAELAVASVTAAMPVGDVRRSRAQVVLSR